MGAATSAGTGTCPAARAGVASAMAVSTTASVQQRVGEREREWAEG